VERVAAAAKHALDCIVVEVSSMMRTCTYMPTSYVDGKRIKEIKEKHYGFGCGENHIVLLLGLFVDGFCPFKKEKRNSTWAIKMICYNLPPEVSFV
jgi:hypothetical protein